ncbi:MAG: cohesin domain-containing protein [Dehalococcoidia bacterium]
MRIRQLAPLFLLSASAVVATILVYAATSAAPAPINRVAVDANITGNSANAIGTTETCISISNGASTTIDIIVDSVPPFSGPPNNEGGLVGFNFALGYDPAKLNVAASTSIALGGTGFDLGESDYPDTNGDFIVGFADFSSNYESGSGVLSRITVQAVGAGTSALTLSNVTIADADNPANEYTIQNILAGEVRVGSACQGGSATATASPTSTPSVTASPTATPTPSPTATPTPSPTATGTPTATATTTPTATAPATASATPTPTLVGQTASPTPSPTTPGQTSSPTPTTTPTPVGRTASPTPTATPAGQTPTPSETPTVKGDADCSGAVHATDALAILLNAALGTAIPCPSAADVTCNGTADIDDMLVILSSLGGTATLPAACS